MFAPNESYWGLPAEQEIVRARVAELRGQQPEYRAETVLPIKDLLAGDSPQPHGSINADLFRECVLSARESMRGRHKQFDLLPEQRFLVGFGTNESDIGGFHSPRGAGYRYLNGTGFAVLLRRGSRDLRTLELARNYLHDSIHAYTFRAFRLLPECEEEHPGVYWAQYGLNFRTPTGISYSAPDLDEEHPRAVNLNRLMDGVTVLEVVEHLARYKRVLELDATSNELASLVADVTGDWQRLRPASREYRFFANVVKPTASFLKAWKNPAVGNLMQVILRSMYSGKIRSFATFLDAAAGKSSMFQKLFMSASWKPALREQRLM